RWASRAFTGEPEWLQIDLGRPEVIERLAIRWEHAYAVRYRIDVSTDARDWRTLVEKRNGRGGREVLEALGGKGRYLRVVCLEPDRFKLFSIWDVELLDEGAAQALDR